MNLLDISLSLFSQVDAITEMFAPTPETSADATSQAADVAAQATSATPPGTMFLIAGVGLGVFLLVMLIGTLLTRTPKRARDDDEDLGVFGPSTATLANIVPEGEKERKEFDLMLKQAGLYSPADRDSIYAMRFMLLILPIMLGCFAAALFPQGIDFPIYLGIISRTVDMTNGIWFVLVGAIVGVFLMIIPRLYVYFRHKSRLEAIRRGLPDTIDMMGMCASGGMNTSDSLMHVSSQLTEYPELAQELLILKRQAEIGSLDEALKDLNARVSMPEMRQLTMILQRGNRIGTMVAGSLNEQADHLRVMRKQQALAIANKMPTKLIFPILFCFAPAALLLLLGPSFMEFQDFIRKGTAGFSQPPHVQLQHSPEAAPSEPVGVIID